MSDVSTRTRFARRLFAGIAPEYEPMAELLSLGQDGRWRRFLVSRVLVPPDARVLDVATGTGLVARGLVRRRGCRVIGLDQSEPMLRRGREAIALEGLGGRIAQVLGQAERLPFANETFDAVTLTYLLRYVDDPAATLAELARVLRLGGTLACLEFHVPNRWWWRGPWYAHTRWVLPLLGRTASREWAQTGRFLGPSISHFYEEYPLADQLAMWRRAGIRDARYRTMSMGGGVVVWGTRADG